MRKDIYQDRARELCLAAGADPDGRVGEGRGAPAWCSYRDAARAEQVARETTAAAVEIAVKPQSIEFQNAPLKVFGQHDEGTLAQMRNCMAVGNVVAGVMCADGHLGYAQPVGAVIAYEKQISISGVGFDIGCFTGDTKVFTLDGNEPEIKNLVGQDFHILASRSDGIPVAAAATALLTRKDAEIVVVTLDDGQRIRCTPDQQFMLRDGAFCRADGLAPGQSLMPSGASSATRRARALAIANNHKVVSVESLIERADVYCLRVPEHANFALAAGVFVHNCGNMAIRLDTPFTAIHEQLGDIIRDVSKIISFGVGRTNDERVDAELFDDADAWRESDMEAYRQKAVTQLGTVGSGNHYVDLMRDEDGFVWIGVHFGSRGLGHTSATRYLKAAGGKDGMNVPPAVIDEDSELGRRYIAAMELAGRYSYAGREWVVDRVRKIIGGSVTDLVHNHHNYAWRENHGGRDLWVVRKGATPAFPGQRGFVGGSMGDDAVIIEGVDSPEAKASLYSTIHGAGRLFGRKEAKRRFTKEQMDKWLQDRGVTLIGADLDESPMAYRRLPDVLAEHAGSVNVLHTLRPFAVAMAGNGEFDPFKD